jgi:hypothetical protein
MRPYEIYYARVTWRACPDERPWLIIDSRPNHVFGCFPISGQSYSGACFPIDSSHPDFSATGLTKSCFIHDASIIEVLSNQFTRRKGELTGKLLADFLAYAGLMPPPG